MKTARINEIFYSYQGEGPYQGVPQVFIRFSGCNIGCIYCDTEHYSYRIFNVSDLLKEVLLFSINVHLAPDSDVTSGHRGEAHTVAITGGEPLCQAGFLIDFLPSLKQNGFKIYLETNGILHNELEDLLPHIDIIAMDFKLPSSTGRKAFWREHEEFLKIALSLSRPFLQDNNPSQKQNFILEESKPKTGEGSKKGRDKEVFVKAVVTDQTTREDWQKTVDIIYRIAPHILLVLQPVTPFGNCRKPSEIKISTFRNIASGKLHKVEVIPQMHPVLGIR